MQNYLVKRGRDAYLIEQAIVQAKSAEDAEKFAALRENASKLDWAETDDIRTFDDTIIMEGETEKAEDAEITPAFNLYFITGYDANGDSADQFVRAENPEVAFDMWRKFWETMNAVDTFEATLSPEEPKNADEHTLRIFLVPDEPARGCIDWNTSKGVQVVAFAERVEP